MSETMYNSIKIDGMGTYPGGKYDQISISGSGKIEGDLQCNSFNTSGISTIIGSLECQSFKTSGNSKIQGRMSTEQFDLSGMLNCFDAIEAKSVHVTGMLTVGGKLNAHEIHNYGMMKVKEEISAEVIEVTGVLDCEGLLNCESFQIELNGTSIIKEIGAGKIIVRKGNNIGGFVTKLFAPKKFKQNLLEAEVIEADEIYLENAKVNMVRGKNITIGPDCIIESIEYRDTITISQFSTVNNTIHL